MSVSKGRVFLVEDEDLIAMLTEDMLETLGYEIAGTAANLDAGLEVATSAAFEVAVLDINLHGIKSYPIAEVLERRGIPFAFVSGYTGLGIDPRFAKAPTLQKPFTTTELADVLSRARTQGHPE